MNLRDLKYIVAVAELGHFGKAADFCNISQPTLSMQIRKLEDYLQVSIFERNNKQVMITREGREIIERAKIILREVDEIKSFADNAKDPFAGVFTLGVFPTLAPYLLPEIVPLISNKYPNLKLLLVEEKTAQLIERLNKGNIDAALLAMPVNSEGLESIELFMDNFYLAVPVKHKLANKKLITKDDIKGEKIMLLEEGHCLRKQALEVCSMMGAFEHQDFRATSMETLRQMVASGAGITLIPEIAISEKRKENVVYIPFMDNSMSRAIGLVWRKTSTKKKIINSLEEIILDMAENL